MPSGSSVSRPASSPSAFSTQLALATGAALIIGLLDAALVVSGIAGARGSFQFVPSRIWAVSPLIWLAVATVTTVALLPFTRRWIGACVPVVLAVVFLAIRLRSYPALLFAAFALLIVLLAALGRWWRRFGTRPRPAAVTQVLGILVALLLLVAALPVAPGPAAVQQRSAGPNVILIFVDTVRYDALFDSEGRVHGDLPTFARLERQSTTFTRAYATSSWTLPSHLSAMTGLPAHELGVSFDAQVYTRPDQVLAERFRQRGYRTAAVISNSFLNAGSGFVRGFDTFQQAQAALDVCRTGPGLMAETYWPWFSAAVCNWTASEVTQRAAALMDDTATPFFLALNYMDAHDPYYVESSCGETSGYRAAIRCLDRHLAPIVDWRSPRRDTILVVVGDHGEQFGEHGLERHGNSLYVQALHVPLMIRSAGGGEARLDATPVSITAVPSLIDAPNSRPGHGGAALAVLHPPAAANLPSEWSALDGTWHLIVRERGADALYYLPTDQAEAHNLMSSNPPDPAIDRLRAAIAEMRRTPRPDLSRFRSLGYLH